MATVSATPPYPVEDPIKYDLAKLSLSGIRTQILYTVYFSHVRSALRVSHILCVRSKHVRFQLQCVAG